jgi:polyferredoxin
LDEEDSKKSRWARNSISIARWMVQFASFFIVNYAIFEIIFGIRLTFLEPIVKTLPFLQTPRDQWSPGAGFLEYTFGELTRGTIPFLMVGLMLIFGLFGGRIFCGWACPTGLIQDLFSRLPSQNKRFKIETDKTLKKVKFGVVLLLFIIFLPLGFIANTSTGIEYSTSLQKFGERPESVFSLSEFVFAFLPRMIQEMVATGSIDPLFYSAWGAIQFFAFIIIIGITAYYPRFYCRALCPYGAMVGLVAEYSLIHLGRNPVRCPGRKECGICERVCPVQIRILEERWEGFSGGGECVLCLECKEKCPHGAIVWKFG